MKKPACWTEYAETDGDKVTVVASDDEDGDRGEADGRPVTPQQRHVFKKAMNTFGSLPGSLPPEVKEAYENATTPQERAVIVNASVPRDVGYKDMFDKSSMDIQVFRKVMNQKIISSLSGIFEDFDASTVGAWKH